MQPLRITIGGLSDQWDFLSACLQMCLIHGSLIYHGIHLNVQVRCPLLIQLTNVILKQLSTIKLELVFAAYLFTVLLQFSHIPTTNPRLNICSHLFVSMSSSSPSFTIFAGKRSLPRCYQNQIKNLSIQPPLVLFKYNNFLTHRKSRIIKI